jgi:hypothetical protein
LFLEYTIEAYGVWGGVMAALTLMGATVGVALAILYLMHKGGIF